jgi:hypothetical protein
MTYLEMEKAVLEQLRFFKDGDITDEEFLEWFKVFVVKNLAAKLPLKLSDTQILPQAK